MSDYTPTTEGALYCSSCWADLKLYPPATELVFERDFTVNTETVRKVYRYVRTDATEFDRWFADVKAQACNHTFAQQLEEHSLAELIRMAKADGFDEGWDARVNAETITPTENPYRQGETE